MSGETPSPSHEQRYYASPGPLTAIDAPELLRASERGLDLVGVVRGLAIHEMDAAGHGLEGRGDNSVSQHARPAQTLVNRILQLDPGPLDQERVPGHRLITYCRHLAVLTTALCRAAAIPARSRCGFCPQTDPGTGARFFLDHWWVELWNPHDGHWLKVEPAVRAGMRLDHDPDDHRADQYLSGPEAWLRCRAGQEDPNAFGVAPDSPFRGAWMVRNNVIRDVAALNKRELLPWDFWGLMDHESALGTGAHDAVVDEVTESVVVDDWATCRALYEQTVDLRAPSSLIADPVGAYPAWAV